MATFDIFNGDAFSVARLALAMADLPRIQTRITKSGIFSEEGVDTLQIMIERRGSNLSLVPVAPRGGVAQPIKMDPRNLRTFRTVHLPQRAEMLADEVQGIRAFGTESETEVAQAKVNQKLAKMKAQIDLTHEYHRLGAIKGLIMDADGTSPIFDLYAEFGLTQQVLYFDIATPSTSIDPVAKNTALKRAMANKLGGLSYTGIEVLCSESWFDAWTRHDQMKKAWDTWQQNAYLRQAANEEGFVFDGVTYKVYSGGIGGQQFIANNEAYAYPTGVSDMFKTWFAPADYMETVNTLGLPYYAKIEPLDFDKGVLIESQSNPLHLNTRPEAVFKLSTAAS